MIRAGGMLLVALLLVALLLVLPAGAVSGAPPVAFLAASQQADGGYAEPGRRSDPGLTAWVVLALAAAGEETGAARAYLADKPYPTAGDLALRILAMRAAGAPVDALVGRLDGLRRPNGRIGPLVNSTIWGVLALRAAGRAAGAETIRYLLAQQARGGGWPWAPAGAPDSNDTAAAIQALRSAGIRGRPISRGLGYLRSLQRPDGGFALAPGRLSDSQSTAWALQAFLSAGARAPARGYRFLERMRRADGSFRYSAQYAVTPVWVTAQVVPALQRKPFPFPRKSESLPRRTFSERYSGLRRPSRTTS